MSKNLLSAEIVIGALSYFSVFTHCMLDNFMFFCRLLIFSKSTFSKNSFRNTINVSNSLDPDQARHFVEPDLGTNCLQKSLADV